MAKQIKKSELKDLIEKGYKMKDLAEYYGIPMLRMKNIVKMAGLRIKSTKGETVIFVDDMKEIEDLQRVSVEEYSYPYEDSKIYDEDLTKQLI